MAYRNYSNDPQQWVKDTGVNTTDCGRYAILFKAVRSDGLSDQSASHKSWGSPRNRMMDPYEVGKTLTAPDWDPIARCGSGLHVSPKASQAKSYSARSKPRMFHVLVRVEDIVPLGADKCKVQSLTVIDEVDPSSSGLKIGQKLYSRKHGSHVTVTKVDSHVHVKSSRTGRTTKMAHQSVGKSYTTR